MATGNSLRDQAVELARKGFRVFPLVPNGKVPALESDWKVLASDNPDRVYRLWSEALDGDPLDYNIGITTGSGLFVLDIDNKDGKHGSTSLERLEIRNDDLPLTFTVRTPNLGEHRYFRATDINWLSNSAGKLGDGLDIRGDGGYVVAPGSIIDGAAYEIAHNAEISDSAPWLRPLITGARPAERLSVNPDIELDLPEAIAAATKWLQRHADIAIEGAGGDATTIRVANRVLDHGLSVDQALDLMLDHWNDRCSPPWDADELRRKVENAERYRQSPVGSSSAELEFDDVSDEVSTASEMEVVQSDDWLEPEPLDDFDPHAIEPRQWIAPGLLARGFVTAIVSPGGTGKTQLAAATIAIPANRPDVLGFPIKERTKAWYWNQEDDKDELRRRIGAVREHFGIKTPDTLIDGEAGFHYNSGVENPLFLAARDSTRTLRVTKHVSRIIEIIKAKGIGVFAVDPIIEFHQGEENNNEEMAVVWRSLRRIAVETHCAVLVFAHTKKPKEADAKGYVGSMDALRGASSQGPVVRIAYTLFTMLADDAKERGVPANERHLYARLDNAKGNIMLGDGEPIWFRRESVLLGRGDKQESLGVLNPVRLERMMKEADLFHAIAQTIDEGDFAKGESYGLTDLAPAMPVQLGALLSDATNRSRLIKNAAKAHGVELTECVPVEVETDFGRLTIIRKNGRGGYLFSLAG